MLFLLQVLHKNEQRFYTKAKVSIQRTINKKYSGLDKIDRSCIIFGCVPQDKITLACRLRVPQIQNKVLQIHVPSFTHLHTKYEYYSRLISSTYCAKLQTSDKVGATGKLWSKTRIIEMESIHGKSQRIRLIPKTLSRDPLFLKI